MKDYVKQQDDQFPDSSVSATYFRTTRVLALGWGVCVLFAFFCGGCSNNIPAAASEETWADKLQYGNTNLSTRLGTNSGPLVRNPTVYWHNAKLGNFSSLPQCCGRKRIN
jgi:hypothetical protein